MRRYVLRRVLSLVPLLVAVSLVIFAALAVAPGDPAVLMLGQDATPEGIREMRRILGVDLPLPVQYLRFVGGALRGDLGRSFQTRRPVAGELMRTFQVTLALTVTALTASCLIGLAVGILSAVRPRTLADYLVRVVILTSVSMPIFWLGLILISFFAVRLQWFPVSGWGTPAHVVLPAATLAAFPLASVARMTRSSVLDALGQDYVRTARAKGLGGTRVLERHVLKNALIPVVTVIGLQFGILLAGAVLTETVFALPGLGRLLVMAVFARDYAIIRGSALLIATSFALINLGVDLLYATLDPRIRYA